MVFIALGQKLERSSVPAYSAVDKKACFSSFSQLLIQVMEIGAYLLLKKELHRVFHNICYITF
jgi:hypothetical protein